jgi:hypothetical protein
MSARERLANTLDQRAADMQETAGQRRHEGAGDYQRATSRLAKSYRDQAAQLRKGGAA